MSGRMQGIPAGSAAMAGRELTPGHHLRAEIERLGLDQVAVSRATGVSRQSINNIVNGRQPISRAMAGKLGSLTGHGPDYWLRASFPRSASAGGEPAIEPAGVPPARCGVLVNHQIVQAVQSGVIGIEPFEPTNVQLASIDLTLDDFVLTTEGEVVDITAGQGFPLRGGRTVSVRTKEWVEFPRDHVGRVGAMASLARIGIMTSHGFQIDPGFKGNLQFCMFNAAAKDFDLRGGMPVISLEIMPLSALPAPDARAERRLGEASDRGKVVALFRSEACDRLIRDAIRSRTRLDLHGDEPKASIVELNLEFEDVLSDAALDAAVQGALQGLKTLRETPHAGATDRGVYAAFFGEIADRVQFNVEQARQALACLGLTVDGDAVVILGLRDGRQAMLTLPARTSKISLRHMARQLRLDAADLILILAGLRSYRDGQG